jgi:hypothetical protein
MPQPVSYNPGTPVSGSIQENSISYVVDGQNRNYRGGFGGLSWMSEVPAANNVIFIGNSVSLGRGPANIPLFYPSYNNSAANIIYAANTLPGSPRNFTTTASAYNWAVTNNFFINNSDNPIPRIDADGLAFYVDASQPTSYPQTGTTWYDMSGKTNNGTLGSGVAFSSNGWMYFNGTQTSDYNVAVSINRGQLGNNTSIEATFKYDGSSGAGYRPIIGGNDPGAGTEFFLGKNSGNNYFGVQDGNYDGGFVTGYDVFDGRWHHMMYTYDNNIGKLYLDGVLRNTGTFSKCNDGEQIYIGAEVQEGYWWHGNISQVKYYTQTLTNTQVKQNYFQSNIVQDGLVFMVDANNLVSYPKSGTSIYNLTGSIVSGSLINGPTFSPSNGGLVVFDGIDDYVQLNGTVSLSVWTITVNLFYNYQNKTFEFFLGNATGGAEGKILLSYAGQVSFRNSNYYNFSKNSSELSNKFSNLSFVSNGTSISLYVDGVFNSSVTPPSTNIPLNTIGNAWTDLVWLSSFKLGDLCMYNKALTSDEVQQNYQATKDKFLGQNIVTNGLQLSYDFANKNSYPGTGTTIYDLSGNSNNGTLLNNPQFSPNANGGVISWDGTDDYIDTGKTATQLGFYGANYTMEAWVYPTSLTSDRTMFGTNQSALRQGLHLVFRNGQIYQGHYASDFTAGTVTTNNWYQIVYTYNASTGACEIFKNSVSQGTGTISSFIGTTNILIASWGGSYYFEGPGGIYRIYNRVLSSTEILQNYNAQKTRFGL